MPDIGNKGVTITYKNNNGIIPLYPRTTPKQIMDITIGKTYGPYNIILKSSEWNNNKQKVKLDEIIKSDIPFVVKSLNGTIDEMEKQKVGYNLLAKDGVESIDGGLIFTCDKGIPEVDITVQVSWNR